MGSDRAESLCEVARESQARPTTDESILAGKSVGAVCEVRGPFATATIDTQIAASVQIGELVLMSGFSVVLVGAITYLQRTDRTIAEIKLVASLDSSTGVLNPGVHEAPTIGAPLYRCSTEIVRAVYEDRRSFRENKTDEITLQLACTDRYRDINLAFAPERIIGRHLAVVGSSGGGKSCSVARLIEQCSIHNSKVVLLDLTGEYQSLGGGTFHTHVGASQSSGTSLASAVPFNELTESDLISILAPDSPIQLSKLRAAIKTLKLIYLEPRLGVGGNFSKAHKDKRLYQQALADFQREIETSANHFDISHLALQIEFECVDTHRSQTETHVWGGVNTTELAACTGLINRVQEIVNGGDLASIFQTSKNPSLLATLKTFLADRSFSVLRVSLEYLPAVHNVREIIANAIGRKLLALGRARRLADRPVLLVVDEAHQVLRPTASMFSRDFPVDAYNIIAKEGRKYGLSLCVATQRPGDIPEDVLSQMGTFIVHRLVGEGDRSIIERVTGACDKQLLEDLPSLGPGEAFIVGIDFSRPLRVRVMPPEKLPLSQGPLYQKLWRR